MTLLRDCVRGFADGSAKRARAGHVLTKEIVQGVAVTTLRLGLPGTRILTAALSVVLDRIRGDQRVVIGEQALGLEGEPLFQSRWIEVPRKISAERWLAMLGDDDGVLGLDAATADWMELAEAGVLPSLPASTLSDTAPSLVFAFSADADRLDTDYDSGIYPAEVVATLLACVATALECLVSRPEGLVGEVPVLSEANRAQLLRLAEPRDSGWHGPATIPEIFAMQVKKRPDATALEEPDRNVTYAELDRESWQIAAQLRSAGVTAGDVVGMAIGRFATSIASLLGILRAGAAYLPVDPSLPSQRIAFMLADASAKWVITRRGASIDLPSDVMTVVVSEDVTPSAAGVPGAERLAEESCCDGDDIAYVMYTSGSTGVPKGVQIRHRSIARLVMDARFMRLDQKTRMLHAAPLGFDASTLEIWGPLLNGGCCVLHPEATPTGAGLARTIAAHGVNAAWLTAALFNAVIDDDPRHLLGLDQLLTGGEALSVPHVLKAIAALPGTDLINGYGPTECTTFATTYSIPRSLSPDSTSVPIGRPINRTVVRVLNDRLELVPLGFVGELCVGGDGLARGYLAQPGLTAERFVEDPFGAPGERLYRTGDLVCMHADGNLEFIGRRDRQIKIRGFRIEPGEIETALANCAGVRASAVIAREDGSLGTRLVAYLVPAQTDGDLDLVKVREALEANLPRFMVPSVFVRIDALPLTANGKLDRAALPSPSSERPEMRFAYVAPEGRLERRIGEIFSEVLGIEPVGALDDFFELGGNSLAVMRALGLIVDWQQRDLSVAAFYDDPSPRGLAARLADGATPARVASEAEGSVHDPVQLPADEPIAIVGMAARLPGAADLEEFWQNLCAGREGITFFKNEELDPSVAAELRADPAYVRARGVIEGADLFDAGLFGISPKEADLMDPQQRVFLELCWECMERAGYAPVDTRRAVGVFAGVYNASYYQKHVLSHPDLVGKLGDFQVMLANEKDYVATRVAHRLNLTGPAISVFTACSTSLVAAAQAVDSLRAGRCWMALAGGAAITCPPQSGYLCQEGSMLSPDGHTRSFDAAAGGTVFSDGAAVVLLKRLSDAIADGDSIHALIKGIAVNNDGAGKASFTAPSVDGQIKVITAAHQAAGVDARSIGYVEAHGTATPLGDPVEIEALSRAFRRTTDALGFCRIGSVKSNIGHTVMAAGAAGLIKAALALEREFVPASIHFHSPNPKIDFARSPFVADGQASAWPRGAEPRRAGVSAFGVGGTNAHAVLEEAALPTPSERPQGPSLLLLSARSPAALQRAARNLAEHLQAHPETNLADAAFTLRVGRRQFPQRLSVVADDLAGAIAGLTAEESPFRVTAARPDRLPPAAFLFPGQGAQYPGMGSHLYRTEPEFKRALDECFEAFDGTQGDDLRRQMLDEAFTALEETRITQPAIFCMGYSLARLWMSRGLQPSVLLGHSVGEFVAAVIAGVFALRDAVRMVARRGDLMQSLPAGKMMAVRMTAAELNGVLPKELSLAAENAPMSCVVAGPTEAIASFQARLQRDGILAKVLATSHAFHSAMMDPAVAPFEAALRTITMAPPRLPIISCVTGVQLTDAEATDPGYWSRHLRAPVRFSPALRTLLADGDKALVECGPRATLSSFAGQHATPGRCCPIAVATLGDSPQTEAESHMRAAGKLWVIGHETDAPASGARRRRIPLPTYPFERKRHWVSAGGIPADPVTTQPVVREAAVPPAITSAKQASTSMNTASPHATASASRLPNLVGRLRVLLEDVSGIELQQADATAPFLELGLDSLTLTQAALHVKKEFRVELTFRQLMEKYRTLQALAVFLDQVLPAEPAVSEEPAVSAQGGANGVPAQFGVPSAAATGFASACGGTASPFLQQVIHQQMLLMHQQLALLGGAGPSAAGGAAVVEGTAQPVSAPNPVSSQAPMVAAIPQPSNPSEEEKPALVTYDPTKAFGAIARIFTSGNAELSHRQQTRLDAFIRRYVLRTGQSKAFTEKHRPHLADPRVVNGFRPSLKEIIYQVVMERSAGAHLWDLDGNEYVDALNGFGMSLFGWQPPFVVDAVRRQLDSGYDIGPQHPLAGEVAALVCELTGFDRTALCNTGSEAVMGALRIARTVTGRNLIVTFAGSYHGIFDEVLVRGTKKLRSMPAAPGIMANVGENVLVLEYGTPESMKIIRDRADELAAVLVEPVQSRRPDFQPREFLRELREVTERSGVTLIFDEVVTGFRAHPGGAQALFGVRADLATYGKVVGGGFPIGIIAGKRSLMDALDGGSWNYGDDSIPVVGVTYFAGTFVRHPLALAAAKAVLEHVKASGPDLQATLNRTTASMCDELNAFCRESGAPVAIRHFSSVWKVVFTQDHPFQDLLFAMMRSRGVHILDNFPCFFTTAHTDLDVATIKTAFKASVSELQEAEFLPPARRQASAPSLDASTPPIAGARIGRDVDGSPAWFVPNPEEPGKFLRMSRV